MSRDLKIFMRGKGVSRLQELLKRMGYPIDDQPGLFGTTTRDAVKEFQSRQGLKPTGSVNDALMNMLSQGSGSNPEKPSESEASQQPPSTSFNQQQLDALIRLLIKKEVITEDELRDEMARPQPLRITQPPLV